MFPAFYSIVRYCPDITRGEGVNVGVVLLAQEKLFARFSDDNRRVAKVFGKQSFDDERLTRAKKALQNRLLAIPPTAEDFKVFISKEANQLLMTPVRPLLTAAPHEELAQLFHEIVEELPTKRKTKTEAPDLSVYFKPLEKIVGLLTNQTVLVPVLGKSLRVPYAYQNGVMNYIKPQTFSGYAPDAMKKTQELGVTGLMLANHPTRTAEKEVEQRLVVVAAFQDAKEQKKIGEILEECKVRVVSAANVAEYVQEIRDTAH